MLSDLGAPSDIKFHAIHRTGKPSINYGASTTSEAEPRPRPILARFVSRARLRAAYKKAKDLNIQKVFIKGKNLIINSSKYSVNTLPEYLLAH